MTSGEKFASSASSRSPRANADHPDCAKCNRRMTVKQVSPVLFASGIDDVVYGCERCGTEAKRTVKRA